MKQLKLFLSAISRLILAGIFWIVVQAFYAINVQGFHHDPGNRSTYFAMVHKRDADPIIELPSILAHRGWGALTGDVRFAMRSDAFSPGFLAYVLKRPLWLVRLLHFLSLAPVLHALGIRPLEKLSTLPARLWIEYALHKGDDPVAHGVLTPTFLQYLARASGEDIQTIETYHLSHLLSAHYATAFQALYSADMLLEPGRGRAKSKAIMKLKQELIDLGAWLSKGGSIWGAPEGQISPDGRVGTITAAVHHLLQEAPPETCIVPVCIIYDFMTVRRRRAFVNLAPPVENAPLLSVQELDNQLCRAWLLHTSITCTQLASGFLVQKSQMGNTPFTLHELAGSIEQEARSLIKRGRNVDQRLLSPGMNCKIYFVSMNRQHLPHLPIFLCRGTIINRRNNREMPDICISWYDSR